MNHIELKVNGIRIARDVKDNVRLIDFLREDLKLTGTKEGCSVGECGACTVILDGKSVCSCLLLAAQCNGAEVTTVEALHHDPVGKKIAECLYSSRRRSVRLLHPRRIDER